MSQLGRQGYLAEKTKLHEELKEMSMAIKAKTYKVMSVTTQSAKPVVDLKTSKHGS